MANDNNTTEQEIGSVQHNWAIPEYESPERSKRWYIVASVIMILLLIYSLWTANLLFGLIIIIAALTIFYMDKNEPREVDFAITDTGIVVGNKFHDYNEIDSFYIIYEPPEFKNLFIEFSNVAKIRLNIPLQDQNPVEIRKTLKKYIKEDLEKESEPISEAFGKMFKL